jgi:hypothetical protein
METPPKWLETMVNNNYKILKMCIDYRINTDPYYARYLTKFLRKLGLSGPNKYSNIPLNRALVEAR